MREGRHNRPRVGLKDSADGFQTKRPLYGEEPLTESFGTGRYTKAEGALIRQAAARENLPCVQVIRKYFLRGLKPS